MNQSSNSLIVNHPNRLNTSMQNIMRGLRKLSSYLYPRSISELLLQLEEAATPAQLTGTMNKLQNLLWKLPDREQALFRKNLMHTLSMSVLQGAQEEVRLEAAGWLRLFVQAGLVTQPEDVFVTLVTAATHSTGGSQTTARNKQLAYLKLIFECFWPFRHPYPAYTWQVFPTNEAFYPLASLLNQGDYAIQDALIGIYAELPALDDKEILEHLLPVALYWSKHPDAERRRRVANVLARINQESAQEALCCLQSDADPIVQESAKTAAGYVRKA
jgi:hypothetical protein